MKPAVVHPAIETWSLRKPAVWANSGMVTSQHHLASDIGARVLESGGNAVDAAVAAGLAIGAVEPWMSGLGGGGFMLVYLAKERRAYAVDFGMRAPARLDPADYPLAEGADADLFAWPSVVDDRNVLGPGSIAVPGFVAGHAAALERFGTLGWRDALAPAIDLARQGMSVDWYATLKIAGEAATLARFEESARTYLPGGHPPASSWGGPLPAIRLGRLADTFERLAAAGPRDFYEGEIAAAVAADCEAAGSSLRADDLAAYQARILDADCMDYRGARVFSAPGLSAGPTLRDALTRLQDRIGSAAAPDETAYQGYAASLTEAYEHRLATLGDVDDSAAPGCTTHMSVADGEGNVVALTQTLLSVFGSKVMLPQTGILMNNGVMWFDPRPGRPNSMAGGKRPLSNMCPTVVERADGLRIGLGASGGRRIMPAVFQLVSFLTDFGMSVDDAIHQPRIDSSGTPLVLADRALPASIVDALARHHPVEVVQHGVYPALFACPNLAGFDGASGRCVGGAYVPSPWAKASGVD